MIEQFYLANRWDPNRSCNFSLEELKQVTKILEVKSEYVTFISLSQIRKSMDLSFHLWSNGQFHTYVLSVKWMRRKSSTIKKKVCVPSENVFVIYLTSKSLKQRLVKTKNVITGSNHQGRRQGSWEKRTTDREDKMATRSNHRPRRQDSWEKRPQAEKTKCQREATTSHEDKMIERYDHQLRRQDGRESDHWPKSQDSTEK